MFVGYENGGIRIFCLSRLNNTETLDLHALDDFFSLNVHGGAVTAIFPMELANGNRK
jgi:hypothetical protein